MATHSSVLAWRILWTEGPGRQVHGVAKSQTQLSDFHFTSLHFRLPMAILLSYSNKPARIKWRDHMTIKISVSHSYE